MNEADAFRGPWVNVAVFCLEFQEQRTDGPGQAILGIFSRLHHQPEVQDANARMDQYATTPLRLVLFTPGEFRGLARIETEFRSPTGGHRAGATATLDFDDDHQQKIEFRDALIFEQPGTYWWSVTLNGRLMVEIPLTLAYDPREV